MFWLADASSPYCGVPTLNCRDFRVLRVKERVGSEHADAVRFDRVLPNQIGEIFREKTGQLPRGWCFDRTARLCRSSALDTDFLLQRPGATAVGFAACDPLAAAIAFVEHFPGVQLVSDITFCRL
jgi:hypothetical protein